jgi:hypothetical protein
MGGSIEDSGADSAEAATPWQGKPQGRLQLKAGWISIFARGSPLSDLK